MVGCRCAAPVQLPRLPDAWPADLRWLGRSGARGWCSTTGCAHAQTARENGEKYLRTGTCPSRSSPRPRRRRSGRGWARCPRSCCSRPCADLNTAYRNFFASIYGQAQGPQGAHRHGSGPARTTGRRSASPRTARFKVLDNGRLQLPKIGDVRSAGRAPARRPVVGDGDPGRGGPVLRVVRRETDHGRPLPETDSDVGIDLGLTHFAVLSDGTKISGAEVPAPGRRRNSSGCSRTCPARPRAASNRDEGRRQGRPRSRAGGRHPAGLAAQALDGDHPRQPSGVRRGPVRSRSRPDPAGEVRARRRLGQFHRHVGVQGRPVRAHLRTDRPVRAHQSQTCSQCGRLDGPKPLNVRSWDLRRAGRSTTGTSTRRSTCRPRDGRD